MSGFYKSVSFLWYSSLQQSKWDLVMQNLFIVISAVSSYKPAYNICQTIVLPLESRSLSSCCWMHIYIYTISLTYLFRSSYKLCYFVYSMYRDI